MKIEPDRETSLFLWEEEKLVLTFFLLPATPPFCTIFFCDVQLADEYFEKSSLLTLGAHQEQVPVTGAFLPLQSVTSFTLPAHCCH